MLIGDFQGRTIYFKEEPKMANKLKMSVDNIVAEAQKKGMTVTSEELMKIVKTHAAGAAA